MDMIYEMLASLVSASLVPVSTVIEKLIPSFSWCWRYPQEGAFLQYGHYFKFIKSKILPQISSKGANFLSAICAIISTPKILSYGNNSGDITKRLFFDDEATHKKSPKTLINTTALLETLKMTCQEIYAQWCHNHAAPGRVFWTNPGKQTQFLY